MGNRVTEGFKFLYGEGELSGPLFHTPFQAGIQGVHFVFFVLALGDIEIRADEAAELTLIVVKELALSENPADPTIGVDDTPFVKVR